MFYQWSPNGGAIQELDAAVLPTPPHALGETVTEEELSLPGVALLRKATVPLTDAQIKALPTTPISVVAAPGAGKVALFHRGYIVADCRAGTYTNVPASSSLCLMMGSNGDFVANFINSLNGDGGFLGTSSAHRSLGQFTPFNTPRIDYKDTVASPNATDLASVELLANELKTVLNAAPTGMVEGWDWIDTGFENLPIQLFVDQPSGDFTGGHANNTLKVIVYYTIEAV